MDRVFWVGIGIGAILSFAASIAANLLSSQIAKFFDSRKLVSREKRKRRELKLHGLIERLHGGQRDKYLYMIRLAAGVVLYGVITFVAIMAASIIAALTPPSALAFDHEYYGRTVHMLLMFFVAFTGLFLLTGAAERYRRISNALDNYEEYVAGFNERWPS